MVVEGLSIIYDRSIVFFKASFIFLKLARISSSIFWGVNLTPIPENISLFTKLTLFSPSFSIRKILSPENICEKMNEPFHLNSWLGVILITLG